MKVSMKSERGFSLLEVFIAILLMGLVGVAFLGGLSTASKAVIVVDERATAESLARSQMEYVRSQSYSAAPWNYTVTSSQRSSTDPPEKWYTDPEHWYEENIPPLLSSDYGGYTVSVSAEGLLQPGVDNCIQRIIIVVYFPSYDAEHLNKKITLEGYRSMS